MNRRHFVHCLGLSSGLAALTPTSSAPLRRPSKSSENAIRDTAEAFLREHGIEGMSIAYGRDGKVAFEQGYGFADADGKEPVTPDHRFRIASISKPITATAVMLSIERGRLKLDSKVFGTDGILGDAYGRDLPDSVRAITIDHLLTHASGGWGNDKDDPMFLNPEMKHAELITWTLANQKQTHAPGENYAYSNFGYCILGRVLEKITQMPYEALLSQHVLKKCGITGMQIAGNTLDQRQANEVLYHTEKAGTAYGMNVARMDSHGGWIATARDLVLFASSLPTLLNPSSIQTMTTHGVGEGYARGWSVNKVPNWWHGGSLPGTSTIMVHTSTGACWAGLLNRRTESIGGELDNLMWKLGGLVPDWKL